MTEKDLKPEVFAREKAADYFPGLKPKTLANYASAGKGPPYFLCGRRAYYRYADVLAWLLEKPVRTRG
jgi:hypothetical protein